MSVCKLVIPARVSWRVCVGAGHPSEFSLLNPAGQMLEIHSHTHTHTDT